ncbi:unnamed protein product [Rotaria sp. Silwood1]|nr:unnamed protein product [Rotaria sp. Silwood1]CAF4827654.1 unnamed protein product [Rotaria sp. Silwood1]
MVAGAEGAVGAHSEMRFNSDHHSLSNVCEKVIEYRSTLKEQVNNAISTGKLHRLIPQDRSQPMQFQMKEKEFLSLPSQIQGATP